MKKYQNIFKSMGLAVLGGLWALEWAWKHCSRICILNINLLAFIVPEISTFIRTWLDRLGY